MADTKSFTPEMQSYFNTLPKFVQESIVQSQSSVKDINDLKSMSQNMVERGTLN